MGQGWFKYKKEHGLAAKGIPTKKQSLGQSNRTANKNRVSDSIQNDMHAIDYAIRRATNSQHPETVRKNLQDARNYYEKLSEKVKNYKQKYGELPWWVSQTWHGKEDFVGRNKGQVWKLMNQLNDASPNQLRTCQKALFDAIKTPREQPMSHMPAGGVKRG